MFEALRPCPVDFQILLEDRTNQTRFPFSQEIMYFKGVLSLVGSSGQIRSQHFFRPSSRICTWVMRHPKNRTVNQGIWTY